MKRIKILAFILALCFVAVIFCACGKTKGTKITDIISEASTVLINGTESSTVEASLGAFEGKQGDYIEFRFDEPQEFNTVFISEKTATIRQYNIYAEIDGKFTLIYTGKHIFQENIKTPQTTTTAFRLEIVNTQIGDDHFIIQGINAYNLTEGE